MWAACCRIRETDPIQQLPIIFLTARGQIDDLANGYLARGNDFLIKPTSSKELFHRVNTQLSLARAGRPMVAKNEESRLKERQKMSALKTRLQGDQGQITFHDAGCGMDAHVRAQISDPFFTTKPVGAGTGFGLSTCHGIIEQHGGHIEVSSIIGKGSTFSVYLPMSEKVDNDEVLDRKGQGG